MKISEITGLSTRKQFNKTDKPLLRTTATHYDQARGNKAQVIVLMPPTDFLRLSAPPNDVSKFMAATKGLAAYNRFAKSGDNIHMPFLKIDVLSKAHGKVRSHEGRHRAAALIKAKGQWMRVALILASPDPDWMPNLAKADQAQHGRLRNNLTYYITAADLPVQIANQYNQYITAEVSRWKIENPDFLGKYRH